MVGNQNHLLVYPVVAGKHYHLTEKGHFQVEILKQDASKICWNDIDTEASEL